MHQVACVELQDAMDLNYLTDQRPGDVLKMRDADIRDGSLHVKQGKTGKFLRIMLEENAGKFELVTVIERIQGQPDRKTGSYLVTLPSGEQVKKWHLRVRFDAARKAAIEACTKENNFALAARIKAFQFQDIRAKSASEIVDMTGRRCRWRCGSEKPKES